MRFGTGLLPTEQLDLSRAPVAELATAALEAKDNAGDEHPAFIVVAVPAGSIPAANEAIKRVLTDL